MITTWLLMAASFLAGCAWTAIGLRKQLTEQRLDIERVLAKHRRSR